MLESKGLLRRKLPSRNIMPVQLRLQSVTIKGKMRRKRELKGAEALASTDSEGESARPTPSKKEKPTASDCDEDDIPLFKPRMPEPLCHPICPEPLPNGMCPEYFLPYGILNQA